MLAEYFTNNSYRNLLNEEGYFKGLPPLQLPEPVQIKAKSGDVIIASYLLCHTIAHNISPNIRYALYFRLSPPNIVDHREESLKNPWYDCPGIQSPSTLN